MSMPVSTAPDLCLLLTFDHIPLSHLVHSVGHVCRNWTRIQREALAARRTLVLIPNYSRLPSVQDEHHQQYLQEDEDPNESGFEYKMKDLQEKANPYMSKLITHVRRDDGQPWYTLPTLYQIEFDVLELPGGELTEEFTSYLMDILPTITHLSVQQVKYDADNANLDQLIRLIRHHGDSLISLKLDLAYGEEWRESQAFEPNVPALFNTINRLGSLQHLTLDYRFPSLTVQPRLTILSQLTSFTSNKRFEPERLMIPFLRRLVGGNVRISCELNNLNWKQLSRLDPRVLAKFERLIVSKHYSRNWLVLDDFNSLNRLCSRLTSLTVLELTSYKMPMTMMARSLAQLTGLIHLNLTFFPAHAPFDYTKIPKETPPLQIVPLPSIRLLTLDITTYSHHDTENLHLHEIFNNLQVLQLHHHACQCPECGYVLAKSNWTALQVAQCMSLARQPFGQCANLHTIKLDPCDNYGVEFRRLYPRGLLTKEQI